ncbi:hypothetical protein KKG52_03755 [Patescibacteria group bacterium]|nr:hypothetical protein [Patescibacteria group bacterium]
MNQDQVSNQPAQNLTQGMQQPNGAAAGSLAKEAEPISTGPLLTSSEQDPNIEQEVKEAGVEKVSEKLQLTKEHEQIGVKHASSTTPVNLEPQKTIGLPMPVTKAREVIKTHKKVADSILWMAKTVIRQFKKGIIKEEEIL